MAAMGIWDPTKLTRKALQNATCLVCFAASRSCAPTRVS
jgi:chaperonin GroEL (HSP60 family)